MPYREPGREQILIRWWPPIRDIAAGMLGLFILYHEEVTAAHGDAFKIGAGIALLGIAGSGVAERLFKRNSEGR